MEDPYLQREREKYRILSLAGTCFSPQLWAYYAGTYTGICLCYWSQGSLKDAKKVQYLSRRPDDCHSEDIVPVIKNDFLIKQNDWHHEKEWRIVRKSNKKYFHYNPDELACIIIGHAADAEIVEHILGFVPPELPKFKTHIGYHSLQVKLLPYDFDLQIDGTPPPFICSVSQLYQYLSTKKTDVML